MLDIFMGICLYITVVAIENLINEDFFILDVAENQITEKMWVFFTPHCIKVDSTPSYFTLVLCRPNEKPHYLHF